MSLDNQAESSSSRSVAPYTMAAASSLVNKSDDSADPKAAIQEEIAVDEHKLTIEQVASRYRTNVNFEYPLKSKGLLQEEAAARLLRDGPNALTPPKKKSLLKQYLHHLIALFNLLLLISGILSFILYAFDSSSSVTLYLGGILVFVAFMNAFIEFYQEYKSASILESFLGLVPPICLVIRDGGIKECLASELVLGDLVLIRNGDKIPADLRLISVTDLKVDNSSITGESEPQERLLSKGNSNPLEASNLAFSGTMAVSGEGLGITIRTGDHSILGQIAKLTITENSRASQLTEEINMFVRKIATIAIITAIIFFIVGLISNFGLSLTFSFAIGTFVAFVPQGLPATVTVMIAYYIVFLRHLEMLLLSIAAKRLSEKNVLVKDLHAVETLGSITLLASDKTGTLTQNKMTVIGAWINRTLYSTQALEGSNVFTLDHQTPNLNLIVQAISLCTKSKFDDSEKELPFSERKIFGDATEVGLIRFALEYVNVPTEMEVHPKVFEIPFSSETKWHLTINKLSHNHGELTVFIKGAPERVATHCSHIMIGDEIVPWTDEVKMEFDKAYEYFAQKGRRVLAIGMHYLAQTSFPENFTFEKDPPNFPMDQFIFIGLVSLMDPPKHGVRKAIAACRTAGIQVVMVTGDHPLTAEAIARQIGLVQGETIYEVARRLKKPIQLIGEDEFEVAIVHGDKLDSFTDADWDKILCKQEIVFARTSPKHKLEIVTRFQNKGHIVGVSGDGVNDSPALKKADLGISMNKTASDVSKEAAAMILLDDNFPSIVNGIAEGRLIFANLKKSIRYTLTHIMPEVLAFLIFIITAIPLPISSLLVLLIDLGSELGPALSYAYELPENDLMLVPPRKVLVLDSNRPMIPPKKRSNPFKRWSKKEKQQAKKITDIEAGRNNTTSMVITMNEDDNDMVKKDAKIAKSGRIGRFFKNLWIKLSAPFRRNDTGEVLVDDDLLIWCYLEGGLIEAAGCFGAYLTTLAIEDVAFNTLWHTSLTYYKNDSPPLLLANGQYADASEQLLILGKAQSAYYFSIIIVQSFNVFICKHIYSYPWGWDMLKNKYTYIGVCISYAVGSIIVFVPWINSELIKTAPFPALALCSPIAAGILLFIYETIRRHLRQKGYFGGVPKRNANLLELVRTTSSVK